MIFKVPPYAKHRRHLHKLHVRVDTTKVNVKKVKGDQVGMLSEIYYFICL